MEDVTVRFLGKNVKGCKLMTEDEKMYVDKKTATEYFLTTFLDNDVYKYGMTMIKGLNKKYKFIISDKYDDRVTIENVDELDPCFPLLANAATTKINKISELKAVVTLASLAMAGALYLKADQIGNPGLPKTNEEITVEAHNYSEDYDLMRKYYNRLMIGEISPAEVFVFDDLVNYYVDKDNLAEDDAALMRRYKFELEDYKSRMVNITKPYTR